MKKFKKIFYLIALLMLSSLGMLFGCAKDYGNMKLLSDLDSDTIVLIYGDEERNSKTFNLRIEGVGGDVSTTIKRPYVSVAGLVDVKYAKEEKSSKTAVTVTAINYGQTDVLFTTEEGGKTYSLTIKCELPVEGITKKSTYRPYAIIGETTRIATTNFEFNPSETTQRDVEFEMMGEYDGVVVNPDGTIVADADAPNGRFGVTAKSRDNPTVYTQFEVFVLRGADSITAYYNGLEVLGQDELYFSPNMLEESYKILEVIAEPFSYDYDFVLNYRLLNENGVQTSAYDEINNTISSNIFEIGKVDDTHVGITAKGAGDEILEITATIPGFDYVSKPTRIKLHSENVAKSIVVEDIDDGVVGNSYTIYEDYKGQLGKAIKITLGGEGVIKNKGFVIRQTIPSQNAEKLHIYTREIIEDDGQYQYSEAKLYSPSAEKYSIFTSGAVLYFIADRDLIEGDESLDMLTLDFVAYGTMGLLGQETKTTITFNLKRGVSQIRLVDHEENETVLVPIKQVVGDNVLVGETELKIATNVNEYTDRIYTDSENAGYSLKENSVTYENSVIDGENRIYTFNIYGIKEGVYILSFYTQNGLKFDVKIRVFTKINKITLTTATVEQNSDIGQVAYTTTDDNFKTLDNGSIVIRLDGNTTLNFNAYFNKYLQSTTFQRIVYEYEEEGIVFVDSMNKLRGLKEGETNVKATITTYDDEGSGEYEINFTAKVYVAIQNVYLNTKNVTLYTLSTLSDYVENGKTNKQEYGEYEFVLKINPDMASITRGDITINWTGSEASNLNIQEEYIEVEKKLILKVSLDSLSIGREEGRAKLNISVVQYGRMFVKEADILFKNATKVSQIYDVKQEIARNYTNATQYENSPLFLRQEYQNQYNYYLYFDIRDANEDGRIQFNLDAKTYPLDALNPKLIYLYKNVGDYENVLKIVDNKVTIENAGLAFIEVCAVDSFSQQSNTFATKVTILVKVADGNSQSTALEISKPSDLIKINQNKLNLEKFYIITKNINLASQSSWTPIGYIDGEEYEFNGFIDGLLENNSGEIVCATISGLKLNYSHDNIGLFAKISKDAIVRNLEVSVLSININTSKAVNIGAVCGQNAGECHTVTATVNTSNIIAGNNSNIGGLAGKNTGTIFNCYALGEFNIEANAYIGGLVGQNNADIDGNTVFFNDADMNDSYNSEITINAVYENGAVGGIVGYSNGNIENVAFDGILNGNDNVGGIAGLIEGYAIITNSFASGFVSGNENVGGLVGYAAESEISNSSVNMFDSLAPETSIIGTNNVGGLVGKAENVTLQNAYARSYISPERVDCDIIGTNNVGGLIGYANDVTANKVYSIQKISGTENVGGLIGYANNIVVENAFERNTFTGDYGFVAGMAEGTNSVEYFYSSNDVIDWTGWSFAKNKEEIESGSYNWYKPDGETYPYLIFTNEPAKLLTVEAPTEISLEARENNYLVQEDIDGNSLPENTYVLFRGKTSQIKFANLFNVLVAPNDELLNVSKAYAITSSDTNIIQITGKTQNDYRLKINSTGKVVLTITSKMNSAVQTSITLFVLNAVSGYELSVEDQTLLVGTNYEIVQKFATNYVNNNNFFIKFTNENAGKVLINNDAEDTKIIKNNEKIYIKASKNGNFELDYQLFVEIDIDGNIYRVALGNDKNNDIITEFNPIQLLFIYGIRDFSGDTNQLETGLNDITNLTYTLTGDDLRKDGNLPYFAWKITTANDSDMRDYWNTKLVTVRVYCNNNSEPCKTYNYSDIISYVDSQSNYTVVHFENLDSFENEITKIEFVLEVSANVAVVQNYFKAQEHINEQQFEANLTLITKIVDSTATAGIGIASTAEAPATLAIKRQKIDNISLKFYANAEIDTNGDEEYYNINEVPSNAIVNGQTGIMKIAINPINAEVKSVKVSYSNASGYVMSMNQVLKYIGDSNTKYIDRKPYAVATDDGKGIYLYHNESNYYIEDGSEFTTYDGYLYIALIVASKVPAGQIFTVTIDAIYTNGYHYVTSANLVSRLKSEIEFGYNFDYTYNSAAQTYTLDNNFVIPVGIEKEFYVDYTELIDATDLVNIESKVSPSVFITEQVSGINYTINLAKNEDGSIKIKYLGNSSYRVYYTIQTTNTDSTQKNKKLELYVQMVKTQNSIQTTFKSGKLNILVAPYVVTGIDIVDGTNNILTVPQSSPRELNVDISYETSAEDEYYQSEIDALAAAVKSNYKYWFGKQSGVGVKDYTTLIGSDTIGYQDKYENYYVNKNSQGVVSINVKNPETTDMIYLEIPFEYKINDVGISIATPNGKITGPNFSAYEVKHGENVFYAQTLRDYVTINLTNDVSSEHPIPVGTPDAFIKMSNGTDGQLLRYALSEDIDLENYVPKSLENISFDGNGHTITIKSFAKTYNDNDISKYGLFNLIDSNSIVKNLTIKYTGLDTDSSNSDGNITLTTDIEDFNISEMYFGGVAVTNEGIIYNTKTTSDYSLNFIGDITKQTYIAGVVCENLGYISYSTSELNITANCGYVAGFAAVNNKKISNSKVVVTDGISNTLTSLDMSLTGGFVARNRGDIFGCYISGSSDVTVSSRSTLGGFVNQNSGNIDSCYSDVNIDSTLRASGFVYENEGTIKGSYSSSTIQLNNSAHTPFVGTDSNANFLNSGDIEDCYFVIKDEYAGNMVDIAAKGLSVSDAKKKSSYEKFVFATDNKLDGTWKMTDGNSYPQLVDANIDIFCQLEFIEVKTEIDAEGNPYSYYLWNFVANSPEYGKEKGGKYNPRIITNYEDWNDVITFINDTTEGENQSDCLVLLCDLTAERDKAPLSSTQTFEGTMFGNNMKISNLYLRANSENSGSCFGLFASVDGALVKDMTLIARQVVASAARCVGVFAGYINDSDIVNIVIDGTNIEAVQGRNMVGAFAGLINNSNISKIDVSGSVNAGYIANNKNLKNYNDSDIEKLTGNGNETPYSYAGTFAGALVGGTVAKLINITGANKVIGFYAGSCVGLVDAEAKLILAKTEIVANQYVRAYGFAGGLVGENRGIIDRCFVEHSKIVQDAIDSNTTYKDVVTGRNLTFFAGSPKFIGGLVGFNNGGEIQRSYSKLDVRVSQYSTLASGGLVGLSVAGTIKNCYATGSVINRYIIGGLVGVVTNKTFLLGEYKDSSNNDIRYDTYQVFDNSKTSGTYTTNIDGNNAIIIKNCFVSNKWIVPSSASAMDADPEFISQATTGLLIGQIVNPNASADTVSRTASNNYINLQVSKSKNEVLTPTNLKIENLMILKDLIDILKSINASYSSLSAMQMLRILTIGSENTLLDNGNYGNTEYEDASYQVNDVLVSFENLLNKDELLLDATKGLFKDWSGCSAYFNMPTNDANSPIYPEIIRNINAE